MVGSAGPTMVWSSAPRKRPSMTAKRISIFSRWLRPRAGSSSRLGMYSSPPLAAGNASMWCLLPPLGLVTVVGSGRRVRMGGEERDAQGGHRCRDPFELGRIDLVEDLAHDLRSRCLDVLERLATDGRDTDEDDPAILGNPDALDETALFDPIDEPGRGRVEHVEHLREAAHRDLAVALEQVHDVQLGHADAETNKALAADTLEFAE